MTLLDFMFSDMSPFKRKTKSKLNERSLGFMFCLPSQDFNLVYVFCFFGGVFGRSNTLWAVRLIWRGKKSLISEVVVKMVWSVHGCIRGTGYQSSNMAARQFLSSGPSRYCTQKPHSAQKETAVKQLTGQQQFIINLSGLLIFPIKLKAEKKSRKSPEKSFILQRDITASYLLLCPGSFWWTDASWCNAGVPEAWWKVTLREVTLLGTCMMRKPNAFLSSALSEQLTPLKWMEPPCWIPGAWIWLTDFLQLWVTRQQWQLCRGWTKCST